MRKFLKNLILLSLFSGAAFAESGQKIESILVTPEDRREDVLDSLPVKVGDVFEERILQISERLLKATESFHQVKLKWEPSTSSLVVELEPKRYFLDYEWIGDHGVESDRIQRLCILPDESVDLGQERISQIVRCVQSDLQGQGYLDAQALISESDQTLRIELILGQVYRVKSIGFQGLDEFQAKEFERRVISTEGKVFHAQQVKEDTGFILKELLASGYYFAEVFQPLIDVHPDEQSVSVEWRVKLGPKFKLRFSGDTVSHKSLDDLIEQGESFPQWFVEEIQDSILTELRQSGFLDAEVQIQKNESDKNSPLIHFITRKNARYRLTKPDLMGVNDPKLVWTAMKKYSELQAGSEFQRDLYRKIVNTDLSADLYQSGYLDLQVRGLDFTINRENFTVTPVIYMTEGELYRIESLELPQLPDELENLSEWKDLLKAVKEGKAFSQSQVEVRRNEFVRAAVAQAYLDFKMDLKMTKEKTGVAIKLVAELGPRYKVAKILVRGAKRTKERILRDEVGIEVGDLYLDDSVRDAVANILRLGILRSVDIRVLEKDAERSEAFVIVDIIEAARFRFEVGPGYGTLDGLRGIFKATYANIGGTGRRLSLYLKANKKIESAHRPDSAKFLDVREVPFVQRKMILEYLEPRILFTDFDGRLSLANSRQNFDVYGDFRNTFSAALDYRWSRRFFSTTQYSYEYSDPFNVKIGANIDRFDTEKATTLTSIGQSLTYQFLDDNFSPIKGFRSRVTGDLFHKNFGGDENFWQMTLKQEIYYPVWRFKKDRIIGFGVSLNSGFSDTMNPTTRIPIQKRFYLGGENSVRGFDEKSINPPNSVGGDSFANFQTELNIPLFFGVDLLGFYDGGNLFSENSNWTLKGMRYGAGGGLRWNTPVGPLKIGYGFNLDRRRIDGKIEPFGAFYFGVGVI